MAGVTREERMEIIREIQELEFKQNRLTFLIFLTVSLAFALRVFNVILGYLCLIPLAVLAYLSCKVEDKEHEKLLQLCRKQL